MSHGGSVPTFTESRGRSLVSIVTSRCHRRVVVILLAIAALASITVLTVGLSLALFTAQSDGAAIFGTKAVFPGERGTPAFEISDSSSGTQVDGSSPFAFLGDSVTIETSSWSTGFASDRYLEFDFNDSLASGVPVTSATFELTMASSAAGQACFFFEVRSIASGAVLGTYGSAGSPVGCATGAAETSFSTAISELTTTGIANDLRVRVYGSDSTGGPNVIDLATVDGQTAAQTFTLYPVMFVDVADTTVQSIPWELSVP